MIDSIVLYCIVCIVLSLLLFHSCAYQEGAGEELLGVSGEHDAGGNKKLPPIGVHIV